MNASETCQEFSFEFASIFDLEGGRREICLCKDFSRLLVPYTLVEWSRDEVYPEVIVGWAVGRLPRRLVLVELILSWRCWPVIIFGALVKYFLNELSTIILEAVSTQRRQWNKEGNLHEIGLLDPLYEQEVGPDLERSRGDLSPLHATMKSPVSQ